MVQVLSRYPMQCHHEIRRVPATVRSTYLGSVPDLELHSGRRPVEVGGFGGKKTLAEQGF